MEISERLKALRDMGDVAALIDTLALAIYDTMRDLHADGVSYGVLSRCTGIPRATVQKICGGRNPRFTVNAAQVRRLDPENT